MKKADIITTLLLLCGFIAGCSNEETAAAFIDNACSFKDPDFSFVVAADPQLFRGKKEDLDKAIHLINNLEPNFVVMCGDMVETSGNLQQIQAYKESVAALSREISLFHVPGNHDLGKPVKKEKADAYRERFGPLWFYFTRDNNFFISLCSDILADPNAPMHKEQKDWLTGILKQTQSGPVKSIFVFMHHPLYLNTPDEPDNYSNMPTGIRRELLDMFAEHRVSAVFSGHLHDNRINRYRTVELITTSSVTVPMGEAPAGFRVVDFDQRGYEHKFCSVAELETQGVNSYEKANVP